MKLRYNIDFLEPLEDDFHDVPDEIKEKVFKEIRKKIKTMLIQNGMIVNNLSIEFELVEEEES